jgi:hypothetical protein
MLTIKTVNEPLRLTEELAGVRLMVGSAATSETG